MADQLLADLGSHATVDRHLADQLVFFAALARGGSRWRTPQLTTHLSTNLALAERFGVRARCANGVVDVEGLGLGR